MGALLKRSQILRSHMAGWTGMATLVCMLLFMPAWMSSVHAKDGASRVQMSGKPFMALRTNMFFDALLLPNIGVEVGLPMNFTISADWFGTWISSKKYNFYWQGYGGYLSARYYFGKAAQETPFTGHHVGIYGSCLTHDVEFGGKGYQADKFGFGGGIEYGYSLPIADQLCIDFNLGLGFQGGKYKVYKPADDGTGHYVWLSTHRRRWWGPTKLEISLKWLISPMGTAKKGGRK